MSSDDFFKENPETGMVEILCPENDANTTTVIGNRFTDDPVFRAIHTRLLTEDDAPRLLHVMQLVEKLHRVVSVSPPADNYEPLRVMVGLLEQILERHWVNWNLGYPVHAAKLDRLKDLIGLKRPLTVVSVNYSKRFIKQAMYNIDSYLLCAEEMDMYHIEQLNHWLTQMLSPRYLP